MPKKTTRKIVKKATRKKLVAAGLSFKNVVDSVSRLHSEFLQQTTKAVNMGLTLRNWFIGADLAKNTTAANLVLT